MQALKEYLALTDQTQEAFAKKADIEPAELNHYINGRREPRIKKLRRISQASGIPIEKLVAGMGA